MASVPSSKASSTAKPNLPCKQTAKSAYKTNKKSTYHNKHSDPIPLNNLISPFYVLLCSNSLPFTFFTQITTKHAFDCNYWHQYQGKVITGLFIFLNIILICCLCLLPCQLLNNKDERAEEEEKGGASCGEKKSWGAYWEVADKQSEVRWGGGEDTQGYYSRDQEKSSCAA